MKFPFTFLQATHGTGYAAVHGAVQAKKRCTLLVKPVQMASELWKHSFPKLCNQVDNCAIIHMITAW